MNHFHKSQLILLGICILLTFSLVGCMYVPQEEMRVSDFTNFNPLDFPAVRWTTSTVGEFLNEDKVLGNTVYMELKDKSGQPIYLAISKSENASIAGSVWRKYADQAELGFWVYFNNFPGLFGSFHKPMETYHVMAWFQNQWTFRIQAPDRATAQKVHDEIRSYVLSHRWKDFTPQAEAI